MEEKRTHLNLKIRPSLKSALEKQAHLEGRNLSNMAEVLLESAVEQLRVSGDSLRLREIVKRQTEEAAKAKKRADEAKEK